MHTGHYRCDSCLRDIETVLVDGLSHPILVRVQVAHLTLPHRFDPRGVGVHLTDLIRDVASSPTGIKEFCVECFADRTGQVLQPTVQGVELDVRRLPGPAAEAGVPPG